MDEERWIAVYEAGPHKVMDGWQIRTDDSVQRPVAIVPEPIGGRKDEHGRNPYQAKHAALIAAAPDTKRERDELLAACHGVLEYYGADRPNVPNGLDEMLTVVETAIANTERGK